MARTSERREHRLPPGLYRRGNIFWIKYYINGRPIRESYETTGDRDLTEAGHRLKPLTRFFTGRQVVDIDGPLVSRYVKMRQDEGRANGTINREIDVLSRALLCV